MEARLLGAYALIALLVGFFAWVAWRPAMERLLNDGHGRSMRDRWLAPKRNSTGRPADTDTISPGPGGPGNPAEPQTKDM
jgi:hypothetical protein